MNDDDYLRCEGEKQINVLYYAVIEDSMMREMPMKFFKEVVLLLPYCTKKVMGLKHILVVQTTQHLNMFEFTLLSVLHTTYILLSAFIIANIDSFLL